MSFSTKLNKSIKMKAKIGRKSYHHILEGYGNSEKVQQNALRKKRVQLSRQSGSLEVHTTPSSVQLSSCISHSS